MVEYTILSSTEQDVKEKEAEEALEDIKEIVKIQDKWIFVDGEQKSVDSIDASILSNAETVTLTDMLTGG